MVDWFWYGLYGSFGIISGIVLAVIFWRILQVLFIGFGLLLVIIAAEFFKDKKE